MASAIPAPVAGAEIPAIPLRELLPWLLLVGLLSVLVIFFISADQGAISIPSGTAIHEWVHDGRHLLAFPLPLMGPRQFLVHGLLAGLFAGIAAFAVAYTVGEPPVDAAIAVEEAGTSAHSHDESVPHSHDEGTTVSRENQSTWGLATGTLAVGTALGGLVALATATAVGRLGRLRATQSAALVTLVGFVAVALVPFLKYPATPPAVGEAGTIGERTELYFGFLALSVLAAVAAVVLAARLLPALGAYRTVVVAAGGYLLVVAVAAGLMPGVDELGDFPASTLWEFRRASLLTLATLWAGLGVALVGLVGRSQEKLAVAHARRELAASL